MVALGAEFVGELPAERAPLERLLGDGQTHVEKLGLVGLEQVVVRAGFEDAAQVGGLPAGGADKDVGTLAVGFGAQPPAELEAVHAGQVEVEHNQGEEALAVMFAGAFGAVTGEDRMAAGQEHLFQQNPRGRVVFYNQDLHFSVRKGVAC